MKTLIRNGSAAIFAVILCGTAHALPRGYATTGEKYLENSTDLSRWSFGIYADLRERDVDVETPISGVFQKYRMKSDEYMGYLGYDALRWLTVYATAGGGEVELKTAGDSSSSQAGVGLKINLVDHEIMDPTLLEDRIRLNAAVQYSFFTVDAWPAEDADVQELSASLTLSLVNDIVGNKLFLPNGIGIFGGGLYSDLLGGDVDEDSKFGYTAGVEVFYTDRVTLEFSIQGFDDITYCGGIHLRL